MEWILQPEPCEPGPPAPIIEDLLTSAEFVHSDMPMVWLRRALILSEEVITNTALATKGQRNNPMWSIIRKNRITASNFGAVLSTKRRQITISLKKRLMSSYNLESIKAVAWGITHEEHALKKYEHEFSASVQQTGIWLHESGVLGASPDGLVLHPPTCDVNFQTPEARDTVPDIVEVKCPYSAAHLTIYEAVHSLKDFYLEYREGFFYLKSNHPYFHQIQGQLHLCNKNCCDLIVWTTKDCKIIRITKDSEWTKNIAQLIEFYFNTFIPELIKN